MNIKISYLVQTTDGLYRYKRKVPLKLRKVLRRDVWNYSLGRDQEAAMDKRDILKDEHDDLIRRLKDGDTADAVRIRTTEHISRMERLHNSGPRSTSDVVAATAEESAQASEENKAAIAGMQSLWLRTPDVMEDSEGSVQEYRRLATHLVMAFGDARYLEGAPKIPDELSVAPPSGGKRLHWDALHKMLLDRLEQIAPGLPTGNAEERLSVLMKDYIAMQKVKPNTERHYNGKVRSLIKNLGDHPLPYYTKERLQTHRDLLISEAYDDGENKRKATTVMQHFAPLKALWRWAADEKPYLTELQFPPIRLPKAGETVDEIRWQSFDDTEIARIWQLINDAWGPKAKSKMTLERRASFRMAIRVMLYTGLRPAEVFRLTPSNVKNDALEIRETKTTGRRIPISNRIGDLPEFLKNGGFQGESVDFHAEVSRVSG